MCENAQMRDSLNNIINALTELRDNQAIIIYGLDVGFPMINHLSNRVTAVISIDYELRFKE